MGVRQFKHLTKWIWLFCCDFEFNRDWIGDDLIVCYCSLQAYRNINWFHNMYNETFFCLVHMIESVHDGLAAKDNDIYFLSTFCSLQKPRYVEHFCNHQSHSPCWIAYFTLNLRFNIELQKHPIEHHHHHHQLKTVYILEIDSIWLKIPLILPFFICHFASYEGQKCKKHRNFKRTRFPARLLYRDGYFRSISFKLDFQFKICPITNTQSNIFNNDVVIRLHWISIQYYA